MPTEKWIVIETAAGKVTYHDSKELAHSVAADKASAVPGRNIIAAKVEGVYQMQVAWHDEKKEEE